MERLLWQNLVGGVERARHQIRVYASRQLHEEVVEHLDSLDGRCLRVFGEVLCLGHLRLVLCVLAKRVAGDDDAHDLCVLPLLVHLARLADDPVHRQLHGGQAHSVAVRQL
jgi:hypothetical protein